MRTLAIATALWVSACSGQISGGPEGATAPDGAGSEPAPDVVSGQPDGGEPSEDATSAPDEGAPDPDAPAPDGGGAPPDGGPSPDADVVDPPDPPVEPDFGTTRRLSTHELRRSLKVLTGLEPAALGLMPPDSLGHAYDRVVDAQSLSRAHLDAYWEIATEVANTLIGTQALDTLAPACSDEILPPLEPEVTATIIGASLGLEPEWAVQPGPTEESIATIYAPSPTASVTHGFETEGAYRIELDLDVFGPLHLVTVSVAGEVAHTQTDLDGLVTVAFEVQAEPGTHVIEYAFTTEPENHNLAIDYLSLRVTGPLDLGAAQYAAEREACAEALVDEFGPLAWRRPWTADERERVLGLYAEAEGAAALRMLVQAILAHPAFGYLVEVGAPVAGEPGTFELNDWEVAQRLSYALCEEPPDEVLREAAAAGELSTPEQIEDQARRLLTLPCASETLTRFMAHWMHLAELHDVAKSPDAFPLWSDDVRAGLVDESHVYFEQMFFAEEADLELFFTADYAWPDPRTAEIWGIPGADGSKTTLPPTRRGALTLPSVMAATAPFDTTSPVHRGVFVLEQVLCTPLPPPPDELMVVPPPPDPELTTQERWEQHSSEPACAYCHSTLDPIGFAFEEFDGIGQHRTTENGKPVDATGGVPPLGVPHGDLVGGAELGAAVADSQLLRECFAKQWLRFALGRLEGDVDDPAIEAVASVLESDSMQEGVIALIATETFTRRYESQAGDESGEAGDE